MVGRDLVDFVITEFLAVPINIGRGISPSQSCPEHIGIYIKFINHTHPLASPTNCPILDCTGRWQQWSDQAHPADIEYGPASPLALRPSVASPTVSDRLPE